MRIYPWCRLFDNSFFYLLTRYLSFVITALINSRMFKRISVLFLFYNILTVMSYSVYTSVLDLPLIKWSCRLLVNHHILNRMNSSGIALYIFCRQLFHPEQQWWDNIKTIRDFFIPVFIVLSEFGLWD